MACTTTCCRLQLVADSVLTLDLTINNSYTAPIIDTLTACDSLVWQGTTYTSSRTYTDTLQTASGCDSILDFRSTINDSYSLITVPMTAFAIACKNGRVRCILPVESHRYTTDAEGCDSVISTDLTINSSVNGDTTTTVACDSAAGYDLHGEWHVLRYVADCSWL